MSKNRKPKIPTLAPNTSIMGLGDYKAPRKVENVRLKLDANEGMMPSVELLQLVTEQSSSMMRLYPDVSPLHHRLSQQAGIDPSQLVVTAGGDDALDRACRAMLSPGTEMILPVPTFEMLERYPVVMGAEIKRVPWSRPAFPTKQVLAEINTRTRIIALVSPNNPTGSVASTEDLRALSQAAPHALILVDAAYAEFADFDLTPVALSLPNAVVVKTLSKAWGLAGLRVGYALGPAEIIAWLRAAGSPYSVSRPAIALACAQLDAAQQEMFAYVQRVRLEREKLAQWLSRQPEMNVVPSQANFLLVRSKKAKEIFEGLAARGILVRFFEGRPELKNCLRITLPGNQSQFVELQEALEQVCLNQPVSKARAAKSAKAKASLRVEQQFRQCVLRRTTNETDIEVTLQLDGTGQSAVKTGIGFLDHMLTALAKHSRMDIALTCRGDLEIDDHHTAEDCALSLGTAIEKALGDKKGIRRYGSSYAPLDEALARTVVDFSGRPFAVAKIPLTREAIGGWSCENIPHFFQSLALASKSTLHVEVLKGDNDHHKVEAAFKSLALALREAIALDASGAVPSTKGVIDS